MTNPSGLYLNKAQLKAELDRCLNCKNQPCMTACPVNCNPQEFINHAKNENFDAAVSTITRTNPMGQTCGLICPDKFCMNACTRRRIDFPINIPKVQATILENFRQTQEQTFPPFNGRRIAVIGAGPAGMAAVSVLLKQGYKITVYEAADKIGGALNLIPDNRLPHHVIEKDWSFIFDPQRVTLHLNSYSRAPEQLLADGYDGVIVASGEPNCTLLDIPGEEHALSYTEYLSRPDAFKTESPIAIIGGGAVAVDCALTAKAAGSSHVEMFVRRQLSDMRVTRSEYFELLENRIDITTMTSPVKIEPQNAELSLFTARNHFVAGKLRQLPDSIIERPGFAYIIKAVGSYASPHCDSEKIICAGDCKHGGSTIVEAIASGQEAAELLHRQLISK